MGSVVLKILSDLYYRFSLLCFFDNLWQLLLKLQPFSSNLNSLFVRDALGQLLPLKIVRWRRTSRH